MSTPNTEQTTATTTEVTTTPVTQDEVKAAVTEAKSTLPENPTGKDFAEMINALPERIVDALREATATPATTETKTETTKVEDTKSGPFFGYNSFGEWFFGKKND